MSRINMRYYRAHPPTEEMELSPAAYIVWHAMSQEQQDDFKKWARKMNRAMQDFTDHAYTALRPLVEKLGRIRM